MVELKKTIRGNKNRIISTVLIMCVLMAFVVIIPPPVAGAAVASPFEAKVLTAFDSGVKFEGRNTLVTAFQVKADAAGLELYGNQNLSLAYDSSVLQLLRWDAANAVNVAGLTDAFVNVAGTVNGHDDLVANRFFAASGPESTVYLSFEASFDDSSFACPTVFTTLQQVRFVLRDGKASTDIKNAIWLIPTDELGVLGSVAGLRAAGAAYVYGEVNGSADTLARPILEFPEGVTLSGFVSSYDPKRATTVRLLQGATELSSVTVSEATGWGKVVTFFEFNDVAEGVYTLEITKAQHLKLTLVNVVVGDECYDFTAHTVEALRLITLRTGDINDDTRVNSTDLGEMLLPTNYNRFVPAGDPRADLDGDARINSTDLGILLDPFNYNRQEVVIDAVTGDETERPLSNYNYTIDDSGVFFDGSSVRSNPNNVTEFLCIMILPGNVPGVFKGVQDGAAWVFTQVPQPAWLSIITAVRTSPTPASVLPEIMVDRNVPAFGSNLERLPDRTRVIITFYA